jgi:hypothetical protein
LAFEASIKNNLNSGRISTIFAAESIGAGCGGAGFGILIFNREIHEPREKLKRRGSWELGQLVPPKFRVFGVFRG